ncbi:MAG: Fe(3+) ABC transporter substrate-binding protein [Rhodobacterales bacterium]|nr:Fe(3+) ABC transporter substrate-binding protein [Rhodobacterales bacterium]
MYRVLKSTAKTAAAITATLAFTLPSFAQEVNVYSYRQPELIKPLMDQFTAQTGIAVNVAFLKKGMIEKLRAEGDRTPADLIFTVDIARLSSAVDAGLTQTVTSDVLSANIPAEFRDPDGEWFGLTTRARVIFASKTGVSDGEVTTYDDLADPKWKGRICTRSGLHAYTVALVSAAISHMGEDGAKTWLEGVKSNLARKPQGNDRAQIKAVWAGECDIALGNTYYMGNMLNNPEQVAWADSVNVVFPTFEGDGTHVNVSGMALTKYAPHRADAIKLMEFLASPNAQEIYAEQNYEYPVAPGTQASEFVRSWGSFTADSVNLMDVARLRPTALRIIEEVDFDG